MDCKTDDLFEIEKCGDTVIVTAAANLGVFEFEHIEEGARRIHEVLDEPGVQNLIVDLSNTDYCGSAGLEALIALHNEMHSRCGKLMLCGLSSRENEILAIMKLEQTLPTYESLSDALRTL